MHLLVVSPAGEISRRPSRPRSGKRQTNRVRELRPRHRIAQSKTCAQLSHLIINRNKTFSLNQSQVVDVFRKSVLGMPDDFEDSVRALVRVLRENSMIRREKMIVLTFKSLFSSPTTTAKSSGAKEMTQCAAVKTQSL